MQSASDLLAGFRIRFPEFSQNILSDERAIMYLDDALCIFCHCEKAVLYLAAHLYVMDRDQGAGVASADDDSVDGGGLDGGLGLVTKDGIGKKETQYTYQSMQGGKNNEGLYYEQTLYGRKYIEFAKKCTPTAFKIRVLP